MHAKGVDPSFTGRFLGPLNPVARKLTSTVVSVSGIQQAVCYDITFKHWGLAGVSTSGFKVQIPFFRCWLSLSLSLSHTHFALSFCCVFRSHMDFACLLLLYSTFTISTPVACMFPLLLKSALYTLPFNTKVSKYFNKLWKAFVSTASPSPTLPCNVFFFFFQFCDVVTLATIHRRI